MKKTTHWRALLALTLTFALAASACGSSSSDGKKGSGSGAGKGQKVRLVPQDFAESQTLTNVYGKYLKAQGFAVTIQKANGFRDGVYPALQKNKADLIIDYDGSAATFLDDKGKPSADSDQTYARLEDALKPKKLEAAEYSKAEDANALLVTKKFASANSLTKISDLKGVEDKVVFGASSDCTDRADCLKGYKGTYGLKFKDTKVLEYGQPLGAALEADAIQAAQYQTTAPEIGKKFVVLEDDMKLLSADNVTPIFRTEVSSPELTKALNTLSAKITTKDLITWNESTDIDKEDPEAVAQKWLEDNNLL